jgi:VWFA-related protein
MGRLRSKLAASSLTLFCVFLVGASGDARQQNAPQRGAAQNDPGQDAGAKDGAQQSDQPIFRTGINFVRVDVIVTDSKTGQPVADLKQSDFQVTENGAAQTVETFKLIKLDGGVTSPDRPRAIQTDSDEESEAARDDVRLFAIFLDDYHVRRGTSVTVREPIAQFISTQLGPTDMIGVMYPLQPVSSVRMTRNHDLMIQSVGRFVGRKGDYTPQNAMEAQYANYPAEEVERIRNQISLSALEGLITHMGSLKEGRKALILVSEGYSNSLPRQMRDPIASVPGLGNPDVLDANAGRNDQAEESRTFFNDASMNVYLREVFNLANRNNVAIYPVDPRGLPVSAFDFSQPTVSSEVDRQYLNASIDTLRTLAEETDGRAIVNRNDLAPAMAQIVRDTSGYYLLGYNSTQAPSDGKFHEIKVRVNRPGIQVRARRGYWAVTEQDVARALAPKKEQPSAVSNALAAISVPAAARSVVRTWVGTSRGANGKTKVTFVWEPTSRGRDAAADAPSSVMLTAVGSDGAPYFRGRTSDSRVVFDADPGKMQLRLSVEGSSSQVLDTETREVAVPDLTAAETVVGTPQLLRARTARDYQLLKTNAEATPVATREFSRTERLLIRVPAYGPGGAPPTLTANLLNRGGERMTELKVAPSPAPDVQEIELALAGLAAGEYILEVKAGDIQELVGFRVTP